MTEPRKSTVFDYSDLRLHPDGTRVYQKSTNLRPKLTQSTVQTARSNWIATDAGGTAKVPLFRGRKKKKVRLDVEEDEENEEGNVGASLSAGGKESFLEAGDDNDEVDENGLKRRSSRPPDYRTVKRQKFLKTDDYLANPSPSNTGGDVNLLSLPHPSPDLLKCIHRFTSEFYHEKGQLLNSSRQYRKDRKERRMKRTMNRESSPSSHSTSSNESRSKSTENVDGCEGDSGEDDSEGGTTAGTRRRKRRKGRHRSEMLYVDMYKVFDGSAMMALGMLVQERIACLLKPSVPERWEREIRSAYTDPWGDSPQLAGDGKDGEASQASPEGGKESQGAVPIVVGGTDKERRRSPKETIANMEGSPNHSSQLQVNDDGWASEEDDDSSRSDDTRRSSDSEEEYR